MSSITKTLLFREIQNLSGQLFDLIGRINEIENRIDELERPIELGKRIQITKLKDNNWCCNDD